MRQLWKLSWDVLAVIGGLYLGYRVFLFSGDHIPVLGYFPIGVMLGLGGIGIGVLAIHAFEGLLTLVVYKITKYKLEEL